MKTFLSAILIFGFLWTQFYNSIVVGVYTLDKQAYIEEFCENTQNPELQCEGKCHLSEQLLETNTTIPQGETPVLLPQQDLFTYHFFGAKESLEISVERNFPNHQSNYDSPIYTIERPPKV